MKVLKQEITPVLRSGKESSGTETKGTQPLERKNNLNAGLLRIPERLNVFSPFFYRFGDFHETLQVQHEERKANQGTNLNLSWHWSLIQTEKCWRNTFVENFIRFFSCPIAMAFSIYEAHEGPTDNGSPKKFPAIVRPQFFQNLWVTTFDSQKSGVQTDVSILFLSPRLTCPCFRRTFMAWSKSMQARKLVTVAVVPLIKMRLLAGNWQLRILNNRILRAVAMLPGYPSWTWNQRLFQP